MTTDEGRKPEGAPARSPIAGGDVGALASKTLFGGPQDGGGSASIARRGAGFDRTRSQCLRRQADDMA